MDGSDARLALQMAVIADVAGPGALGMSARSCEARSLEWRAVRLAVSASHGMPRARMDAGPRSHPHASLTVAERAVHRLVAESAVAPQEPGGAAGSSGWAAQPRGSGHPSHGLAVRVVARSLMASLDGLERPGRDGRAPPGPRPRPRAPHSELRAGIAAVRGTAGGDVSDGQAGAAGDADLSRAAERLRSSRDAWTQASVLARACAAHGMEQEALVLTRWAALLRGGAASYLDVEAAAAALASVSDMLPAPRPTHVTTRRDLRHGRLQAIEAGSGAASGLAALVPLADAVASAREGGGLTSRNWPAGVPVPSSDAATRLHWAWELLAAARTSLAREASVAALSAQGGVRRGDAEASPGAEAPPVPGRLVALVVRVLLPRGEALKGSDGSAWGAAMAVRLVADWAEGVAPGAAAGLGLVPEGADSILRPDSAEAVPAKPGAARPLSSLREPTGLSAGQADALGAAGAGAALEALASSLMTAGRAADAMVVVRGHVAAASAADDGAGADGDAAPGEASLMPSSALFARVVGSAAGRTEESLTEAVEALFASGRRPTVAVFREVLRAMVTGALRSRPAAEVDVLRMSRHAAAALGEPVPPSVLGWCAFFAAQQGWWGQVAAVRAFAEKHHPGVWETSMWAGRVQALMRASAARA